MTRKLLNIMVICLMIISILGLTGCNESNIEGGKGMETEPVVLSTPEPVLTSTPSEVPVAPAPSPTPTSTPAPVQEKATLIPDKKDQAKKAFPILYYHAVNDKITGIEELFVSPGQFEKQMEYLKNNNYQVITFDDMENIEKYDKPVIITLDDGYEDNYTYVYPILKKYGFKATIYQVVDFIDKPLILNRDEIKEMGDVVNFQSHTLTHPYLTRISAEEAEKEIVESKRTLQELTGKPVTSFAYPIGDYNNKVIEIVKKHYKYAVCNGGGLYTIGESFYEMKRVYISRGLDLEGFKKKINGLQ